MVPRAEVLMKTGLRALNTARPVNTAHPKTTVYNARPMSHFSKSAQSTVKRPYQTRTILPNKIFSQKVNTANGKFYTARPKAVNTTRQNSTVVNAVRANQVNAVKASACFVWRPTILNSASITLKKHNYGHPQKEDQGYVDSGCSRHMTGNMSYLSDFKEFDGGYGPLGEDLKEGKLLVKELLKLMCDKKNNVLFTDTGCFILSPDFKLADESQVLLKVPRKNNVYSVDMKNIVPKECITYLVAKATLDESMLWHRRLGHVNFKTINKLVKENLVRGLPLKCFENGQTCVACLKGKQHKASCKSKIQNSITQPLFMLHMDLFGPTFVSSLMNKKYYPVVTYDYSRFTWVFFLATKDETSGILKSFITEIENLVDKKVKIIRCDNGTEFKNKVMRFFVGYSLNSKAFRVYNIRTRKVEENLHIRFLEDKPIIAGDGPKWLFDIDVLTKSMNYVAVFVSTNPHDLVGTEESIGTGTRKMKEIEEEVYVYQPSGFEDPEFPNRVYKVENALYGLHQAPRACTPMETSKPLLKDAEAGDVDVHLYRSMIGSLIYLTSSRPDIIYLKGQPKLGLWYPKDLPFDLEAYTDSDYDSASLDRKSTTGGCQFLGSRLISWQCKKQTIVANSTMEVEYVVDVFANMRRQGKDFSGTVTPLFPSMLASQAVEGEGSGQPTEPQHTPTTASPSYVSSGPTTLVADETVHEERGDSVERAATTTASLDAEQDSGSGPRRQDTILGDKPSQTRFKRLSERVLALENIKTTQNLEIINLNKRVKKLEKKKKARTLQLKRRLFKVMIESSAKKSLGDQEDTSKQGRNGIDQDEEISWFQEDAKTQGSINITTAEPVTTASAPVTTAGVSVSTTEPKSVKIKKKAVTTAATTTTTAVTRPKARGVVVQEPSEFRTTTSSSQTSQLPQVKDKGKAKMIEPEKPLKKKDQILVDEEIAQRLQEELQAELEEEERLARQKEEEDNLISWDNTQAMMEADYELAQRLQAEEQGELTIEERSKLFVELMDKRKKHFAKLRAEEIRRKPPTKAQKRNQMYSFVPIDSNVVEGSKSHTEGNKKRTREELESDDSKKQKIDERAEAEVDDKAEMKKHKEIVPDDEVAVDAIPLATKPPNIDREDLETLWKLVKAKHGNTRPEEAYERVL
ncbi:putative ribonuclease H-like domain-containing protein [Tanacetum coccineum]